jgi:charged multivesicular body protein 6
MGGGGSKSKSSTKGSNKRVTKHDQAVLDLKVQRDKLKQYQKRCEAVMTRETEIAKTLLAQGKKAQALIALKKKKLQATHLARSQAQLDNVSTLIDSVEFAQIELKVFDALKAGNVALGQLHDQIGGVDAVEELLLDTEDAIARQNEIDEALGQSLAAESIDEDEILAELDELEAAQVTLPDAPTHALPTVVNDPVKLKPQQEKAKPQKQKEAVLA